ncbi:hypothetical protein [Paracoccus sp. S4493]|uniref:hypothetical protein n=1 Tax=Paracoccus sp. S4493 TaxID=579490 RepID=UPI0009FCDC0A|nr:hypothetical protein [Paracoccus sp. S4493]
MLGDEIAAVRKLSYMPLCILVGGRSVEHDSSLHMYYAFRRWAVSEKGNWHPNSFVAYLPLDGGVVLHDASCAETFPADEFALDGGERVSVSELLRRVQSTSTFVYSLLQGTEGEDGAFQGAATVCDIESNFGPVRPASISADKFVYSLFAASLAIPELQQVPTLRVTKGTSRSCVEKFLREHTSDEIVIKPNDLGASVFCSRHKNLTYSAAATIWNEIFQYTDCVLLQKLIIGTEYSHGCIQVGEDVVGLPSIKLLPRSGFLGQKEKFEDGGYRAEVLSLDDPIHKLMARVSHKLFVESAFANKARFDFIANDLGLFLLEANSQPGLTDESHLSIMLNQVGLSVHDLVALSAHNSRLRRKTLYTSRYDVTGTERD